MGIYFFIYPQKVLLETQIVLENRISKTIKMENPMGMNC
jgi:hypothetical protein